MNNNNALFTLYKARNYGTKLQAYALYNVLNMLTNEDVFILSEEVDNFKEKIRYIKSKNIKKAFKRLKYLHYENKFEKNFKINDFASDYNNVIIGSDELWNLKNKDFEHSVKYLGKGLNARNTITYAMSCNTCIYDEFKEYYGNKPFEKFSSISVRDEMTRKLVEDFGNKNVVRVLDPTFLYDFKVENQVDSNYILIYGYYFLENERKEILEFAREKNLKLISVGFDQHGWCDKIDLCSVKDFLSYVKYADYVITSTFHGSVFSIIFNKQFASFARDNMKVLDLIEHFGLSERNGTSNRIDKIFSNKINYTNVNNQIKEEREMSLNWLKNNLK